MKKFDFLIQTLKDKHLKVNEITDIYYETCSDNVDEKRQSYVDKGKPMTEKQLRSQISAELGAHMIDHYSKFFKIDKNINPHVYSLSDIGVEKYNELFSEDYIEPTNDIIENVLEEEESDSDIGIVYLMKSKIHKDTYKIGITKNHR